MKIIIEEHLTSIRNGDLAPLKLIFEANYKYCIENLVRTFRCSEADAKDVSMDAILVLSDKIMSNEYLNQNVRSFLLTVASNKWRNKQKRKYKLIDYDPVIIEGILNSKEESVESIFYKQKVKRATDAIHSLSDPCKTILTMNLIKGISLDAVYLELGYKNKAVLKTTKTRCMKKLRQAIKSRDDEK